MPTTSTTNPARYLGGAILAIAVFSLMYIFFVRTTSGQAVDQLAYDGADFGRRSVTPITRGVLDALPTVSLVIGLVLTLIVGLVRRNGKTLLVAMAVAVAAIATTQLLKYGALSRPDLGVDGYAGNSFPSGHTTVAAASALAIFLVASPRTRPLVGLLGSGFAVVAGVSTLADGWHRPSDVIAGLLVVAFWGCLGGAVLALGRSRKIASPRIWTPWLWWLAVPLVVVSAIAFVITYLHASGPASGALIAYVGGVTSIVAAGFVIALAAARLFARLP